MLKGKDTFYHPRNKFRPIVSLNKTKLSIHTYLLLHIFPYLTFIIIFYVLLNFFSYSWVLGFQLCCPLCCVIKPIKLSWFWRPIKFSSSFACCDSLITCLSKTFLDHLLDKWSKTPQPSFLTKCYKRLHVALHHQ